MIFRRVVTGHRDGRAVVISDGPAASEHVFASIPGMAHSVLWATQLPPEREVADSAPKGLRAFPSAPGEMRLNIAEFPPESVKAAADFDPVAAEAELRENVPGYGDHFDDVVEEDGEIIGYHATPTVDFGFVMRGPLWLDLGDDEMVRLETGDVVVQQGTNHAWRNLGTEPARIGFVLIGARAE